MVFIVEIHSCERGWMHYGTKPGHFETSKIPFLTSKGVSEASGPVLTSRFLFVPDHSGMDGWIDRKLHMLDMSESFAVTG